MIQVLLYPDALSMVGSMNAFEIYCSSKTDVVFALRYQGSSTNIVQHTYTPNDKNRITLSVKDIILPLLSFEVKDSSEPYVQPNIMKSFVATLYEVGSEDSKKYFTFSVIRAGVDRLSDSATNFLKNNFLTWQPQVKAVTYYSPEFLTYYATAPSVMKCKAYMWNGTAYEEKEVVLMNHMNAGTVYTVPVQYAIIAKKIGGSIQPSYYDIWVEQDEKRVTYIQRYYASDMKSEEEEWFLFENSLGGVDCFRAYGNSENTAEHTHNVAEIEEDSEEYRVDTTRKFKKNTGFLDKKERLWLLDFFPSLGKYVYHGNSLRKITVTESDVNYEAKELPSNYTFTYKYSDARPYLNLTRSDASDFKQMDIHLPEIGNFTIAPRLVEFPRQLLSGGVLFPVQEPYSETWGVTTADAIFSYFASTLSDRYSGGGGIGHQHFNIEVLNGLSYDYGYILYHGDRIKAGMADDCTPGGALEKKMLRKDIDDTAHGTITFEKVQKFLSGFLVGENFSFDKEGNIIAHSIVSENSNADEEKGFSIAVKDKETGKYKLCVDELLAWGLATVKQLHVKGDSTFDGNLLSKHFISDFLTGKGWGIYNKPIINADGVQENKWTGEFDNVIVRGSLRVYEMIISQLLGENDNRVFAGMMEVDHYDSESGKVYLNTQDGKINNPFRRDDIIMVQQYNGEQSDGNNYYITKGYELIVTEVGSEGTGKDMLAWVKFKNFTCSMEDGTPEQLITQRDTFVRVDNISDPDRKGIMQIITVGTASPHLDVIYGLKTDPEGALKGRLGNLEGIVHPWFGRLHGFGEYLNNLYAVGDFVLRRTGENVDTKLQVLENMFSTRFAKTSYELTNGQNYLENGQFLDQINDAETPIIDSWEINTDDETMFWVDENGMPFMVNSMLTTSGNKKVTMEQNDGRQMLRIQNCGLRQKNAIIKKPGTHKEYQQPDGSVGDNGLKNTTTENVDVQDKLYVNVRIYAKTAGQLTYGFEDCTAVDGKENTLTAKTENIAYSGEWQTVMMDGNWNGTGDFVIRYSGDCYIALVAITDEPLSDLRKTVSTQIMQTAENIKLLGENIDNVNGTTTHLGIELNAAKENISLYVKKTDKNTSDISQMKIKVGSIEQTVGQAATQEQLNENVKALNKSISSNLDAAKNYANDVGSGIRDDYSSTITTVQQKSDSWSVAAGGFDENGNLKESAGAVLNANFAGLFASQVDEKGLVSTGQMNIAISNGISSATIQADHINLTGHTMAFTGGQITINTDNFKLDKSGSVSMNGKITATSGQIAGMKISGLSLTNEELNNDACIILRNNNRNTYAAIGGNVVAPETGMRAVASFTYGEKKSKYDTNSAMIVGASGAGTNIAIDITGGYINGLRIRTAYLTAGGEHIYNPVKIPKGVNSVILAGAGYYELPAMDQNDDGYVIFVKNDYDGSVNISVSTGVTVDGSSKNTFILYDKGNQSTDLTISYRGYAMFFVYHRDVSRADISAQSGCWVQYKCPRSW